MRGVAGIGGGSHEWEVGSRQAGGGDGVVCLIGGELGHKRLLRWVVLAGGGRGASGRQQQGHWRWAGPWEVTTGQSGPIGGNWAGERSLALEMGCIGCQGRGCCQRMGLIGGEPCRQG